MSEKNDSAAWFLHSPQNGAAKLRLFCFPYAGGNAHIFNQWTRFLPSAIEICAVLMPGRGSRLNEKPFTEISTAVEILAGKISAFNDLPFAFFGHSLGATLAYEIVRHLENRQKKTPVHLFVSGRSAPQTLEKVEKTYRLSEERFIESVRKLGGTPPELFENRELLELVLPSLKADFQMVQDYRFIADSSLNCPITAFGGASDEFVGRESINAWEELTAGNFTAHFIEGDHFFINNQPRIVTELIAETFISSKFKQSA